MNILVNPSNMSNSSAIAFFATEAAWLWDLRTDLDVSYGGMTSATTPSSNQTLIRMPTLGEWNAQGLSSTIAAATISTSGSTSKLILLNPSIPISSLHNEILLHELGHALEYFAPYPVLGSHSNDSDDIMYFQIGVGNFPITTNDAQGVIQNSSLPSVDIPDITSSYLRWDNDLFVPDILIGGNHRQVQLDYLGIVDLGSGAKHTWNIYGNTANEEGSSSASYVSGSTAYLHSVQSSGQDYANATLSVVGSQVQLDSWMLA